MNAGELMVRIGADLSGLDAGMKKATADLKQVDQATSSLAKTFADVAAASGLFVDKAGRLRTATGQFATTAERAAVEANALASGVEVLGAKARQAETAMGGVKRSGDTVNRAMIDLSRFSQDAAFGFVGVVNNVEPLIASFSAVAKESGSARAALGAVAAGFAGPAGLLALFSIGSTLLLTFGDDIAEAFGKGEEKAEGLTRAIRDQMRALEDLIGAASRMSGAQLFGAVEDAQGALADLEARARFLQAERERVRTTGDVVGPGLLGQAQLQDPGFRVAGIFEIEDGKETDRQAVLSRNEMILRLNKEILDVGTRIAIENAKVVTLTEEAAGNYGYQAAELQKQLDALKQAGASQEEVNAKTKELEAIQKRMGEGTGGAFSGVAGLIEEASRALSENGRVLEQLQGPQGLALAALEEEIRLREKQVQVQRDLNALEVINGGKAARDLQRMDVLGAGSALDPKKLEEIARRLPDMAPWIEDIKRVKQESLEVSPLYEDIAQAAARAMDQVSRGVGDVAADLLFFDSGLSKAEEALQRLDFEDAKARLSELWEEGEISGERYRLEMEVITERMKEFEASTDRLKSAWESAGDLFKTVLKQLIADLVAAIAKALILKALTAALGEGGKGGSSGGGVGGFLGSILGAAIGFFAGGPPGMAVGAGIGGQIGGQIGGGSFESDGDPAGWQNFRASSLTASMPPLVQSPPPPAPAQAVRPQVSVNVQMEPFLDFDRLAWRLNRIEEMRDKPHRGTLNFLRHHAGMRIPSG